MTNVWDLRGVFFETFLSNDRSCLYSSVCHDERICYWSSRQDRFLSDERLKMWHLKDSRNEFCLIIIWRRKDVFMILRPSEQGSWIVEAL